MGCRGPHRPGSDSGSRRTDRTEPHDSHRVDGAVDGSPSSEQQTSGRRPPRRRAPDHGPDVPPDRRYGAMSVRTRGGRRSRDRRLRLRPIAVRTLFQCVRDRPRVSRGCHQCLPQSPPSCPRDFPGGRLAQGWSLRRAPARLQVGLPRAGRWCLPSVSVAEWFSIEVSDGSSSARAWREAYGDAVVAAAHTEGLSDWLWHEFSWCRAGSRATRRVRLGHSPDSPGRARRARRDARSCGRPTGAPGPRRQRRGPLAPSASSAGRRWGGGSPGARRAREVGVRTPDARRSLTINDGHWAAVPARSAIRRSGALARRRVRPGSA